MLIHISRSMAGMRHRDLTLRSGSVRGLSLVVCAAVCSLSLGSCRASSTSSPAPATSKAHAGSTTTTSSTTPADGQIISAWLAAEQAFHDAALTSDPNAPELAATMVAPLLDGVRAGLTRWKEEGDIAKGPSEWGNPHITARGPGKTEVVSCVHDEEIEVVAKTGTPVPGVSGQADFELVTSIMQSTPDGWKQADQKIEAGKCVGS